ncbi:MAG: 3-methylcrotonyl-CoA carboxylase [Comamonadaceae bacterium]|nr:3-methylcrotonyl-CoA carboxylase [Rubrivivax sp.]NLZ41862.1 3-methylcrotonyl-CoA carboxylase [Comamonadaceae bacterium]
MPAAAVATPFAKLLVANRGEVALRIMRSARRLGLRTVAVYSDADADAPHVEAADQALCIGGAAPAQSYLDVDAIVAAALRCGADAVHPGYGFLAENAAFAAACRAAGLVFVGPSAQAMESMGHKARAKRLMTEAGVPCIPGCEGRGLSDEALRAEAERIGWPLMIKATCGGGGRGMRVVHEPAAFLAELELARAEAQGAFGNPEVMLERALCAPRHIEVQILADRHARVLHLGERDCSVQRRHQKLVEETPSPAVGAALRQRICADALAAARAIGYEGAGTVEFLLDGAGAYYFIEANTRLQVEHPVTEAVTGLDLVEWQLRIAAGEALPFDQEEIACRGHAIEVRLCAEDPAAGFAPSSGRIAVWQPPPGVRVEHALRAGSAIAPWYDSMIGKLVAHGATRERARRRLVLALEQMLALGIATNQSFLRRCLEHPVFVRGEATTAFVAEHAAELATPAGEAGRIATAAALLVQEPCATAPACGRAQRPRRAPARTLRLRVGGRDLDVAVDGVADGPLQIALDGQSFERRVLAQQPPRSRVRCDGIDEPVAFWRDGLRLWLMQGGEVLEVLDRTYAPALVAGGGAHDGRVRASTAGRVVALAVAPGQQVVRGQPLVMLEAMKMQHVHAAAAAGRVRALHVAVGDQVEAGRTLVELALDTGTAPAAAD